ncbi:MAG: hypothetical protein KDA42_16605 [Planctomycetales bacterium]|nr:hypothetical protein [Planctomycetales bacterium]
MGRLPVFLLGVVVGAAGVFGAQRYHVVRATDGFYLIPKLEAKFSETYVDVREFGIADWTTHTQLAAAIIKAKKDHLLKQSATNDLGRSLRDAVDRISGP